jgi:hypothetical protein
LVKFPGPKPQDWVTGNDEFAVAADKVLQLVANQFKLLENKPT